jgi:hypothetical protein
MKGAKAIIFLRTIALAVMIVGLGGTIDSLLYHRSVSLFAFDIPGWVVGISGFYMGLRYWRRIPELEKKVVQSTGFSWANFSVKSR